MKSEKTRLIVRVVRIEERKSIDENVVNKRVLNVRRKLLPVVLGSRGNVSEKVN